MSDTVAPDTGLRNLAPQVALEARARELTTLEAAVLVLSPSLEDATLLSCNEELERLHERVDGISSLLGHPDPESVAERAAFEFVELAAALDDLLREIRNRILDADLGPLRLSADRLCETRRADVEALLEVCLYDLEELDEPWQLIDLLVGRLATGEENGQRVMIRDPSRLTPRISEACQQAAEQLGEDAKASLHFYNAVSEVDAANDLDELELVIERHYSFKESLGRKRLLPGVLRSSVLYNISVANRVDALAELDEDLGTLFEIDLGELDAPPTQRRLVVQPQRALAQPDVPPLAEHAGFQAIHLALRTRLVSSTAKPGPAWTIAMGADLSKLEEADREALCADEQSLATPGLPAMLVVGLTVAQRPRIDAELAALEIEPDVLEDHWVLEVRGTLRAQVRDLIRAGRYEESRATSEALTRLLPVWATSDGARRNAARPVVQPSISTDALDLRSALIAPERRKTRRTLGLRPLLAAAVTCIAIVMVGRVLVGPARTVHLLDREELNAISSHLTAAQRDQLGYGSAMFGKIDADWDSLDEQEQYKRALEMASRLRANGVQNVVISDGQKRLRIQIQGGQLLFPDEP